MAWPKKQVGMSIKDGPKGLMSTTKMPGPRTGMPGLSVTQPHPNLAHLQQHVANTFGPQAGAKNDQVSAGTPRSAKTSGGKSVSPSPTQAMVASSMLGS